LYFIEEGTVELSVEENICKEIKKEDHQKKIDANLG